MLPSPVVWIDFQEQVSVPAIALVASKLLHPQRVLVKVRGLFLRHCLKAGQPLFFAPSSSLHGIGGRCEAMCLVCIIELLCQYRWSNT